MENPQDHTLANRFLCNLEEIFLNSCPIEFKPLYYKRYLDDIFEVFKQ